MIDIDRLSKRYGALNAVDGLSLRVERGEILGLVGPNGAGKTTTLRCASGIIPPTAGSIRIAGFDLEKDPVEAKRRTAFVPDEPRLFDYLTARDHLRITSRLYGVADGAARAETLLDELELGDRKDAYPSELSRGMKQKLMVAMALLHRPEALLLDEPLTGLDPVAIRRMKDRIRETARSGVAVILSSHMLHLVEELCRRVVIVVGGKKALDGTLDEIRGALPEGARGDLESIFLKTVGEDEDLPA
ncbi:MAG TPA: ABC transporter ATP-binding protein [Candidatus Polarisedimenticolaceae bacterium]|nr:ABC transporter ATP-binding protein [Candidatus Polarisedimenticolaceae bacterium]